MRPVSLFDYINFGNPIISCRANLECLSFFKYILTLTNNITIQVSTIVVISYWF